MIESCLVCTEVEAEFFLVGTKEEVEDFLESTDSLLEDSLDDSFVEVWVSLLKAKVADIH